MRAPPSPSLHPGLFSCRHKVVHEGEGGRGVSVPVKFSAHATVGVGGVAWTTAPQAGRCPTARGPVRPGVVACSSGDKLGTRLARATQPPQHAATVRKIPRCPCAPASWVVGTWPPTPNPLPTLFPLATPEHPQVFSLSLSPAPIHFSLHFSWIRLYIH